MRYWLFDPKDEYFDPALQGLRLRGGIYRPLPALVENGMRTIRSSVLGLDLCVDGDTLYFRDPSTRAYPHTLAEANARIAELEAQLRR